MRIIDWSSDVCSSDLALVEQAVVAALAVVEEEGTDRARHVATVGRILQLDDLGADVGQVLRPPGTGAVLFDGEDADAFERQHERFSLRPQIGFRAMSWRAMKMRCRSLVTSPIVSSGASRRSEENKSELQSQM